MLVARLEDGVTRVSVRIYYHRRDASTLDADTNSPESTCLDGFPKSCMGGCDHLWLLTSWDRNQNFKKCVLGKTLIHPFWKCQQGAGGYPSCLWARGGGVHLGHPGQVSSSSQRQHQKTFTPKDKLELACHPSTQMLVFGLWEEEH